MNRSPAPIASARSASCEPLVPASHTHYIRVKALANWRRAALDSSTDSFTAFLGERRIAHGRLLDIVRATHALRDQTVVVFDDATGGRVEPDLRGGLDEALARATPDPVPQSKPMRGRPKLGVTAREVTLLPRHWDWLATQPGGASAALRRLVDEARRTTGDAKTARQAQEAAYRVMTVLAGDLPNYEEATRALFAGDATRLSTLTIKWPQDIKDYVAGFTSGISP